MEAAPNFPCWRVGVDERELAPLLSMLTAAGGNESQQPGGTVHEITFLSGKWIPSRLLDQHLSQHKDAERWCSREDLMI